MDNTIYCPNCKSQQLHTGKKGFSGTNAVMGFIILFGIGFVFGGPGVGFILGLLGLFNGTAASNRIIINCLNCGKKFKPGDHLPKTPAQKRKDQIFAAILIIAIALLIWGIILISMGK